MKHYNITLDSRHWYFVDGEHKPAVTTILKKIDKPELLNWAVRITVEYIDENREYLMGRKEWNWYLIKKTAENYYEQVRSQEADVGKRVHEIIEMFWKGLPFDITVEQDKVQKCFQAFLGWVNKNEVRPVQIETGVYNDEEEYCGTFDGVFRINGELCLLDLKTGKGIYEDSVYQLGAYAAAWKTMEGEPLQAGWILRLGKTTAAFEAARFTMEELAQGYEAFLGAFAIYKGEKLAKKALKRALDSGSKKKAKKGW